MALRVTIGKHGDAFHCFVVSLCARLMLLFGCWIEMKNMIPKMFNDILVEATMRMMTRRCSGGIGCSPLLDFC